MKEIRFLESAREDLDVIVKYYNLEDHDLGNRFSFQIEKLLKYIQKFPESYISVGGRIRRAMLRDFPYNIHYAVYPEKIIVASIAHQRRHPGYWKDRIKDLPKK